MVWGGETPRAAAPAHTAQTPAPHRRPFRTDAGNQDPGPAPRTPPPGARPADPRYPYRAPYASNPRSGNTARRVASTA
ncbi:hypothetical protein QFZ67_003303 [Streptomyces sp. V1I1]|nr:hypothetical protein [Streptomyces sp. V1I1]